MWLVVLCLPLNALLPSWQFIVYPGFCWLSALA